MQWLQLKWLLLQLTHGEPCNKLHQQVADVKDLEAKTTDEKYEQQHHSAF
jgi:hypothetical protein